MLDIIGVLMVATAAFAFVNERVLKLPLTIGVMAIALAVSAAFVGLETLHVTAFEHWGENLVASLDFSGLLLDGALSLMLFAGALHVDAAKLREYRWQIGFLALVATVLTALAVGAGVRVVLSWSGIALPLSFCLLFGALIAPTDPIAVLDIIRRSNAPESVETAISGESLFNDGIGIVLFSLFLRIAANGERPGAAEIAVDFLREAGGGIAFGLLLGFVTHQTLQRVNNYQVEVIITLAAVTGGYALAQHLGVSGPISMVMTGLIVGNHKREQAMSSTTRENVDKFWELVDTILNALLFALMGLEGLLIRFPPGAFGALALVIAVTLAARILIVGLPVELACRTFRLPRGAGVVLVWAGLRGGISIALALSIPDSPERQTIVMLTYAVVLFSVFAQGLTVGPLTRRLLSGDARKQ